MTDEWDWHLTERARRQFDGLDDYARERLIAKLDDIVTDEWREPTDSPPTFLLRPHSFASLTQGPRKNLD